MKILVNSQGLVLMDEEPISNYRGERKNLLNLSKTEEKIIIDFTRRCHCVS